MLISIIEIVYLFRRLFCKNPFRVLSVPRRSLRDRRQTEIVLCPILQASVATRIASTKNIANSLLVLDAIEPSDKESKTTGISTKKPYMKTSNTFDNTVIDACYEMKETIVTIHAERDAQNHYAKPKQCTKHSPLNRINSL